MSSLNSTLIYEGPWINWSNGVILGSTITLSARSGALLTSFLGVFVTVVAGQLWRIFSFIFHQWRASAAPQDGLHHQVQNIFRNTTSPGGAAYQFALLAIPWWNRARLPLLRSLPWATLAFLYLIAAGLAGVFSSQITKAAGEHRLLHSDNCGYWTMNDSASSLDLLHSYATKTLNDSISAASYARNCYLGAHDPIQCGTYPVSDIPWTTSEVDCPFGDDICLTNLTSAYQMDTGRIDSREFLGINAPDGSTVEYRKVTTCSPITSKGYVKAFNGSEVGIGEDNDLILELFYGPVTENHNFTLAYNTHAVMDNIGYVLQALQDTAPQIGTSDSNSTWEPIPALARTDADVSIVMIAFNAVLFVDANDDPVFSANIVNEAVIGGVDTIWYSSDNYISSIACTDQYQICNPNNNQCTELRGYMAMNTVVQTIGLSPLQITTVILISMANQFTSITNAVYGRGASALRAQESNYQLEQYPIPNDQWLLECSGWMANSLARLQQGILSYATGPSGLSAGLEVWQPSDLESKYLCYSQLVRTTDGTISFQVFGLAIILILGTLILFINQVLDIVVGWFQSRSKKWNYARLNWILDDKMQLQRMVYEEVGMGKWSKTTSNVPVTEYGEVFGGWSGVDTEHPRLHRRDSRTGTAEDSGLMGDVEDNQVQEKMQSRYSAHGVHV